MIKNKKSLVLKEAIMLMLAAVIIVLSWGFFSEVYAALTAEKDDGSLANFEDRLVPKIHELIESEKKSDYRQINYFLGYDKVVVGFNKVWDREKNLPIKKPEACSDKACLCIFKRDSIANGNPYKPCAKFDKVEYFLKDADESMAVGTEKSVSGNMFYNVISNQIFFNGKYRYLILYGDRFKTKSQVIYIEKYKNPNGMSIIYLAAINDDTREKVSERKNYIGNINK